MIVAVIFGGWNCLNSKQKMWKKNSVLTKKAKNSEFLSFITQHYVIFMSNFHENYLNRIARLLKFFFGNFRHWFASAIVFDLPLNRIKSYWPFTIVFWIYILVYCVYGVACMRVSIFGFLINGIFSFCVSF